MVVKCLILLGFIFSFRPVKADESITILFEDAYPNFYLSNNKIIGNEYEKIYKAFERAQISQNWIPSSYKRIVISLKNPKNTICAAAYSKNEERLKLFYFSKPMFKIGKSVILTQKKNKRKIENLKNIKNIILNSGLRGGFLDSPDGWLSLIDDKQKTKVKHVVYAEGGNVSVKLLERNRVDFIIIDEFAADYFISNQIKNTYTKIDFKRGLPVRTLHLMCSKAINTQIIKNFNRFYEND